ncbi:hypothetical protein EJ02DRAFT_129906 [Clathrospora elynae]|uniref:Uncharacterized protein n=1 Tax=Clathrospora elynae TaxID=706981 RepID=A0A6A5SSA0_9PLEO|nr:hypothetical protein EJ02DRAFT_129906 [Clathrospora elynae]
MVGMAEAAEEVFGALLKGARLPACRPLLRTLIAGASPRNQPSRGSNKHPLPWPPLSMHKRSVTLQNSLPPVSTALHRRIKKERKLDVSSVYAGYTIAFVSAAFYRRKR